MLKLESEKDGETGDATGHLWMVSWWMWS